MQQFLLYIVMQCTPINKESISSVYYNGAIIPAETIYQLISDAVIKKTGFPKEFTPLVEQYLPTCIQYYVEPVPNIFLWGPYALDYDTAEYGDNGMTLDKQKVLYEKFISLGVNALPAKGNFCTPTTLCSQDYYGTVPSGGSGRQTRLCNTLEALEYFGMPCAMVDSWGSMGWWSETSPPSQASYLAPKIFFSGTSKATPNNTSLSQDPLRTSHLEVYHDFVPTEEGALFNLIKNNFPGVAHPIPAINPPTNDTWSFGWHVVGLQCPNYRGPAYQAALAKLEETMKWLRPIGWATDCENIFRPGVSEYYSRAIMNYQGTVLNTCSRCQGLAGHDRGCFEIAQDLAAIARKYNPNIIITNFSTQNDTGDRNALEPASFSNNSGIAYGPLGTGAPALYGDTADFANGVLWGVDAVTKFYDWREQGDIAHQVSSIRGSYPWISQEEYIGYAGSIGNYWDSQKFYDYCYMLAKEGAKGISMIPGYAGWQELQMWPLDDGGFTTDAQVAQGTRAYKNDEAAERLIPIAIQAFRDYHR